MPQISEMSWMTMFLKTKMMLCFTTMILWHMSAEPMKNLNSNKKLFFKMIIV